MSFAKKKFQTLNVDLTQIVFDDEKVNKEKYKFSGRSKSLGSFACVAAKLWIVVDFRKNMFAYALMQRYRIIF